MAARTGAAETRNARGRNPLAERKIKNMNRIKLEYCIDESSKPLNLGRQGYARWLQELSGFLGVIKDAKLMGAF